MNKWAIIHIHSTPIFTWKPKAGENHKMFFLICLKELHSLEAPTSFVFHMQLEGGSNPLFSQDTTWGKLQLPNSLATTRRRLQPPMFSGYNRKVATTTCPCPVLPPWSRSRMMEPLSHYHCEIYWCKSVPINFNHASTCTSTCTINKCINHAPTCNQPVP